jgi:hypothetical protein
MEGAMRGNTRESTHGEIFLHQPGHLQPQNNTIRRFIKQFDDSCHFKAHIETDNEV